MNKQQEYLNAKRSGQTLALNSFRREHYATALQSLGQTVARDETKTDLYARILKAGRPAIDALKRISAVYTPQSMEPQP